MSGGDQIGQVARSVFGEFEIERSKQAVRREMDGQFVWRSVFALEQISVDFARSDWFHLSEGTGRIKHMYLRPETTVLNFMDVTVVEMSDEPSATNLARERGFPCVLWKESCLHQIPVLGRRARLLVPDEEQLVLALDDSLYENFVLSPRVVGRGRWRLELIQANLTN